MTGDEWRERVKLALAGLLLRECGGRLHARTRDRLAYEIGDAVGPSPQSARVSWRLLCHLRAELVLSGIPIGEWDAGWFVMEDEEDWRIGRARGRSRALAQLQQTRALDHAWRAKRERTTQTDGAQLLLLVRPDDPTPAFTGFSGARP